MDYTLIAASLGGYSGGLLIALVYVRYRASRRSK
jgi:hypothetical protein